MSLPLQWVKHHNATHGMARTRIYKIWRGMHSRCCTPSATGYKNYGGKGIKVCSRWGMFENFYADMGDVALGMSIERVDSFGDYEPGNCKWATRKEQNRNQFDIPLYTFQGKTQCLTAWAEDVGASFGSLKARINRGWSIERTLCTPIRSHKEYKRGCV